MIREQVALADYTTLAVGGRARYFSEPTDLDGLRQVLTWAAERGHPVCLLGDGSNMLVSDQGFDGLVVRYRADRVDYQRGEQTTLVSAQAGLAWDRLVERVVGDNLAGIECLSGIPGWVGAAPIQNIGAYGQEVSQTIDSVEALELETLETRTFQGADCGFAYRESHFKSAWRGRYVVTRVTFELRNDAVPTVRYGDLSRLLEGRSDQPGLAEVRQAVLQVRRSKSMVYDPGDPNHRSAGSFFTNPLVSGPQADEVAAIAARLGHQNMPRYPAADQEKLSAAWLIERAGFSKGHIAGEAGLSTNHVLALINRGQARARDLVALAGQVRARVRQVFGVTLVPEPNFVGFDRSVDELLA